LQSGEPDAVLVDYLVGIEMGHMGLADMQAARSRAEVTVAAIREHRDPLVSGREGAQTQTMLEAAERSAASGEAVTIAGGAPAGVA